MNFILVSLILMMPPVEEVKQVENTEIVLYYYHRPEGPIFNCLRIDCDGIFQGYISEYPEIDRYEGAVNIRYHRNFFNSRFYDAEICVRTKNVIIKTILDGRVVLVEKINER